MNKHLKVLLSIVVVIVLLGALAFGLYKARYPYDPDDFIGLNYFQIVEKYGKFDIRGYQDPVTKVYGSCGYLVKPEQVGPFGTDPPEFFMIYFDKNGIAYECSYETGGWGG